MTGRTLDGIHHNVGTVGGKTKVYFLECTGEPLTGSRVDKFTYDGVVTCIWCIATQGWFWR